MRKITWRGVLCAVLCGGPALAGINPANPGLPTATAYGATYPNNRVSSMCVDCHTENPKPNAGTHFVVHSTGAVMRTTNNKAWENLTPWPVGIGAPRTQRSKYASPAPPAPGALSVLGAQGEMICESCHNLIGNVNGGNNLLATASAQADPSALCTGCHAAQASDAAPRKHHPMTADTVGADTENAAPHALATGHTSHVLATPVPESHATYPAANGLNCISCHTAHAAAEQTGARVLKPGYSTGAGVYAGKAVNLIYANNLPVPGDVMGNIKTWNTVDLVPGIARQSDVTALFGAQYRLVINQDPLCEACHRNP